MMSAGGALWPLPSVRAATMAAYSPRLNPAEYLLHLIRLKLLHHAAPTQHLAQVQQRLEKNVQNCRPFAATVSQGR